RWLETSVDRADSEVIDPWTRPDQVVPRPTVRGLDEMADSEGEAKVVVRPKRCDQSNGLLVAQRGLDLGNPLLPTVDLVFRCVRRTWHGPQCRQVDDFLPHRAIHRQVAAGSVGDGCGLV